MSIVIESDSRSWRTSRNISVRSIVLLHRTNIQTRGKFFNLLCKFLRSGNKVSTNFAYFVPPTTFFQSIKIDREVTGSRSFENIETKNAVSIQMCAAMATKFIKNILPNSFLIV